MSEADDPKSDGPVHAAEPSEQPGRASRENRENRASRDQAELDAALRALRNEPPDADAMARMRSGLSARIEAGAGDGVVPISSHPRWLRWAIPVAAAAAGILALRLVAGGGDAAAPVPAQPDGVAPPKVAVEDEPVRDRWPSDEPARVDEAAPSDEAPALAVDAPSDDARALAVDAPSDDARALAVDAPSDDARALAEAAPSDEALAIAVDYDLLRDYEVIAQLDLLELLDDSPAPAPGAASPSDGEGRI